MKKYYSFCENLICIDAPLFCHENVEWKRFETAACEPDITFVFERCKKLPEPVGDFLGKKGDVLVYADGTKIHRYVKMGIEDGTLTVFDYANPTEIKTFFDETNYYVMADSRYIWSSVSMQQIMFARNSLVFHSSFIGYKGRGILFSAPCGTGKSTQAALWEKHRNAEVINGDKAGVVIKDNSVRACGIPICGTSGICQNKTFPLGAIVLLGQDNKNTVNRIGGVDAICGLLGNIYLDFLHPKERIACINLLEKLVDSVPVYRLWCTPDEDAVKALENALMNGGVFDE